MGLVRCKFFRLSTRLQGVDTPDIYRHDYSRAIWLFRDVYRIHQFEQGLVVIHDGLTWHARVWSGFGDDDKDGGLCKEFGRKGHWRPSESC